MQIAIRKDTCDCCGRGDELKYTIKILPTPEFMNDKGTIEEKYEFMCEEVKKELLRVMLEPNKR